MASWYEDLARSLDLQPADVATAFAGARASVPVYAGLYAGDTNAGHDEELLKRRGPLPPPALPAPTEDEQQRRMIEDFERQFPTPEIRAAAIKHMLAARSGKVYDPSTATRRVDFERQNAPTYGGPEMRATPPVAKRGYQKGGGVRKAVQQVGEQATKGAKSAAKAPRQVPGGALSSSLDVEKLAKALGININEVPNVLPQRESTKNLRKFVGPSAVQHRVYHGSNVPEGIVDDAQFAHYEPDSSDIHWLATDPDFADQYTAKYMEYPGEQGAIFPAHIQLRNPLEVPFDMNKRITPEVWKFAQDLGFSRSDFKEWLLENDIEKPKQAWRIIDSPQFRDAAMERGYDGIRALEAGSETFGVFDRNRIKSQFNEGTYDTGTPDIGKKEGGAVAPTRGYQKGGGVKKTVQQMADELLLKGAKTTDAPNLSRRSFFGLRAQPPADFPLARLDDKALARLEQQYGKEGRAPAFTERTTTVSPDAGATRSTLRSITETPMSRRSVMQAAAGQIMRRALPGVGDVVPGVSDVLPVAPIAKAVEAVTRAAPVLPVTLESVLAGAIGQGDKMKDAINLARQQFPGYDPDLVKDVYWTLKNPYNNVHLDADDADLADFFGMSRPAENMRAFTGAPSDSPLYSMRPYMRALKQASPKVYDTAKAYSKDTAMDSVEGMAQSGLLRNEDEVARYLRNDPTIYDLIEKRQ